MSLGGARAAGPAVWGAPGSGGQGCVRGRHQPLLQDLARGADAVVPWCQAADLPPDKRAVGLTRGWDEGAFSGLCVQHRMASLFQAQEGRVLPCRGAARGVYPLCPLPSPPCSPSGGGGGGGPVLSLFLLCPPPKMITWTRLIPRAWERRVGVHLGPVTSGASTGIYGHNQGWGSFSLPRAM